MRGEIWAAVTVVAWTVLVGLILFGAGVWALAQFVPPEKLVPAAILLALLMPASMGGCSCKRT